MKLCKNGLHDLTLPDARVMKSGSLRCRECAMASGRRRAVNYRATEKGKANVARYKARPDVKAARQKALAEYNASPEGKAAKKRYASTPEGMEGARRKSHRYAHSIKGMHQRFVWEHSFAGQTAIFNKGLRAAASRHAAQWAALVEEHGE